MNPASTQRGEHVLNLCPSFAKNLLLVFFPLTKNVLAEIRRLIEERAGKIQHERPGNNRHLNCFPFFVDSEQLRHVEVEDTRNALFPQPVIDAALPLEGNILAVKLHGEKSGFCIVFRSDHDTVYSKAQLLA